MAHVGPISDDKWDSWEPLVAGLPLILRLILLQDGVFIGFVAFLVAFLLASRGKLGLEDGPGPPPSGALRAVIISSAFAVYALLVWSWLGAYKAKRWAIVLLGILSFVIACSCVVLLLGPDEEPTDTVALGVVAALAAVEGVYLLRLRARLKRLGLP